MVSRSALEYWARNGRANLVLPGPAGDMAAQLCDCARALDNAMTDYENLVREAQNLRAALQAAQRSIRGADETLQALLVVHERNGRERP